MNEQKNRLANRLYESIKNICGEEKAISILEKLPLSKIPNESKRREWACESCSKLHENFDDETIKAIRKGCHCKPSLKYVEELKKLYEESNSIEEFVSKTNNEWISFKAEENAILTIYPRCYCSFLKDVEGIIPSDWCQCSLGYSEYMFREIAGKNVRAELEESILSGDNRCVIRVHFDK